MNAPSVRSKVGWSIGDAVLATVVAVVAGAVLGAMVFALAGYDDPADAPLTVLAVAQVPLWAGLLGIPWWASHRKGAGSFRADFGLSLQATDIPLGLAIGVATQIGLSALIPLYRVLGVDPDDVGTAARELADRADHPLGVAMLVLVTVVGASIIEEICYRGLWLRAAERRWGAVTALVVSSAVFGAVHFQPLDFLPLALFGAVAAALTLRTGRLGPAIFAHAGFNATALAGLLLDWI